MITRERLIVHMRALATLLALVAGVVHIADLWYQTLSADTILAAARGGVLLLLALGLMGTGRLALFLVFVFCATSLLMLRDSTTGTPLVAWLEMALMALTLVLQVSPQPTVSPH